MRFISNGPIIPDPLLDKRDAGRVVFLCGAGVSIPSGMPSFIELTQFVIDQLSPEHNSEIRKAFAHWIDSKSNVPVTARTSLDQIFNLLQLEYGRDQIGGLVSERLTITEPEKVLTLKHKIISRISANPEGSPQIVTTNFDHLFEHAIKSNPVQTYTPPTFPDLRHDVPVTGITYLHGRLSKVDNAVHDYILSSSDFGRAYLSEGWATSFIRQLLQKYIVVLLGYQAEDPPVKYLLQGLNSGQDNIKKYIYAFDQGPSDEIEVKWRDRGVTPIAYPKSLKHQALWETLEAWAIRSDNPAAWRTSTINLSKKGPRAIEPHERGMVAHVLQTAVGAKLFADTENSPPIEWLFVIDKTCRFGVPSESYGETKEKFDPLEAYGLDDDPPRPNENQQQDPLEKEDLIAWRRGDDSLDHMTRLSGGYHRGSEPIPSRLFHLSRWMLKHVEHPALAWWVARQHRLHPRFFTMLKRELEGSNKITENVRLLWMILFEVLENGPDASINLKWFSVERRIKISGWTRSVIRAFETATEPKFKISSPYGLMESRPPIDDWSKTKWKEIANIDLSFPTLHSRLPKIPDKDLPSVFAALERNFIRASERLNDSGKMWFPFGTLYPETIQEKGNYVRKRDSYVICFLELLERMAILNPKLLRAHINTWPDSERYIFDRLRLYVWKKAELFSGKEVSENILGLQDDQFWRSDLQRELLFLLRDRWHDLALAKKGGICGRILNGPSKHDNEKEEEYLARKFIKSSIFLGWLLREGCKLSKKWETKYHKLKKELPDWRDDWINGAVSPREPKVGWVKTEEDADVLKEIPVDQIVNVAMKYSGRSSSEFTEYRPFLGLVKNDPSKALSALLIAARHDDYPIEFWDTIVSHWPNSAPTDETKKLYESISKLPPELVFEVRWTIGDWLKEQFPKFAENDKALAFSILDDLIEKFLSIGPMATESSLGESIVGGNIVRSRKTFEHATSGPLGKITEGLIVFLDGKKLNQGEGLPEDFKTRVDKILTDTGEGSDHAVCILAHQIGWLNHLDPCWVTQRMIPWFDLENPYSEPAWNGILLNEWMNIQSVFDQIKENYLALPIKMKTWGWEKESERDAHNWIVQASLLASDDGPKLIFEEVRDYLRKIDQDDLSHVIWFLSQFGDSNDKGWQKMVIPFIQNAWPRERKFQTEKTSNAWVSMLEDTQEEFPNVLKSIRKLLRPIRSSYNSLHNFYETDEKEPLTVKFPDETLDFLDLIVSDDPRYVPYGLSQILNLIVETNPEILTDRRYQRLIELDASR